MSLQSADNNLRDGAEKELDAMLQQPEEALLQLVHLMGHARDTKVRARASLLAVAQAAGAVPPDC